MAQVFAKGINFRQLLFFTTLRVAPTYNNNTFWDYFPSQGYFITSANLHVLTKLEHATNTFLQQVLRFFEISFFYFQYFQDLYFRRRIHNQTHRGL